MHELVEQLQYGSEKVEATIDKVDSALEGFQASSPGIWEAVQDEARRQSDLVLRQMADGLENIKNAHSQQVS